VSDLLAFMQIPGWASDLTAAAGASLVALLIGFGAQRYLRT